MHEYWRYIYLIYAFEVIIDIVVIGIAGTVTVTSAAGDRMTKTPPDTSSKRSPRYPAGHGVQTMLPPESRTRGDTHDAQ